MPDTPRPPAPSVHPRVSPVTTDLVIIGGGATGHAALAAYRRSGGHGSVLMISEDDRPPYNRPPLSKDFLRGETGEESLPLETPDFYADQGVELVLSDSVITLETGAHLVRTASGREIRYGTCIMATGCRPVTLDVPGGDSALPLRWLGQAHRLRDAAQTAASAVVIGSGFIGCEAAASLAARGIRVTMVSTEPQPQLQRLGSAASELISGWLVDAGVRIVGSAQVAGISAGRMVDLSDGTVLSADFVLGAIGVQPRTELAERAGLEVADHRVVVDEHMRTSAEGVLAAGDAASALNTSAGRHLSVEHWGEAERMGEIAGTVAAGGDAHWSETPGFWSEIGDHTLKYAAWGDGFDVETPIRHPDGGLTVWYSRAGIAVGVLTSDADDDYDRGAELIRNGSPVPVGRGRERP